MVGIAIIIYMIGVAVFLIISWAAIYHYLKFRFQGDLSLAVITIFIIYSLFFFIIPFIILDYSA